MRDPQDTWHPWVAAAAAAILSASVGMALAGHWRLGFVDDAFISLRYATHWASGEGLVFNRGERVEGFTNFLYVALEAALIRLGLAPETAMRCLGWLSLSALSGVLAFLGVRRLGLRSPLLAVAMALLVTLNPIVFCWTLSGLEAGLLAMLIVLAADRASASGRSAAVAAAVALALAAMTRPEAAVLAPILFTALRPRGGPLRRAWTFAVVFCALFGVYFAWRAIWFGFPFPNTFYAKLDYGGAALLRRGAAYAAGSRAIVPFLWLPAAAAAVARARGSAAVRTYAAAALVYTGVVVYEGGDHFPLFRFLVPVVPLLGLLTVSLFCGGRSAGEESWWKRIGLPIAGLACLGLAAAGPCWARLASERTELQRFQDEVRFAQAWGRLGRFLRGAAPADASLGTIAIGAIGQASGLRIVDPLGIIDPVIAHQKRALGEGKAGHEKYDVERVLDQRPEFLLLLNAPTPRPVPEADLGRWMWGEFNQRIIEAPRLRQDYRYEVVHLEDGYWGLHVRRDVSFTPRESARVDSR